MLHAEMAGLFLNIPSIYLCLEEYQHPGHVLPGWVSIDLPFFLTPWLLNGLERNY